jgi:hypothetical protein
VTIDDVNLKYAVVGVGNKMVVVEFAADNSIVELWDFDHFKKRLCKEFIRIRTPDGKVKTAALADTWLRHRRGRQYDRLVYSMPGSLVPAGDRDYNGWQGFTVAPKAGSWALNRQHLFEIICGGNDEAFVWVMNWLAALVQRPGRHAWTAIVMRGGHGIGKGHFADKMIGRLFGPQQYIHILGSGQLTAEFNEHLSGKALIFADESTWGGDPRAAAKLKGMVTEDTTPINRKFLKMIDEPSALHIIIASNNDWPIPIESGDRRFTLLDVSDVRKQDQEYFGALLAELEHGGRAAMLAELLEHEIDDRMLRTPLSNEAKAQVAVLSMKAIEHWWYELLSRGTVVDGIWPDQILKRDLHASYMAFLDHHHKQSRERRATETELGMFLKKYTPVTQQQMTYEGKVERMLHVPALEICRATWVESVGWRHDHQWDEPMASEGWLPGSSNDLAEM